MKTLFEPLKIGALTLKNRIVMAPLTRCRSTPHDHMPTEAMVTYYAQRASAGLIISEATMVAPNQSAFYSEPGIYCEAQIREWRKITDAVHAKGGLIAVQLYHGGRAVHPTNNEGTPNVGPSALRIPDRVHPPFRQPHLTDLDHAVPRELSDEELPEIVSQFVIAAKNGLAAGFDAVEIHAANGYLLDQFLRSSSNQRSSPYGGSVENRARFPLEVVRAVAAAVGSDRLGVRISPLSSVNHMHDEDWKPLVEYTVKELNKLGVAFLEVLRKDRFEKQHGDVLTPTRENFSGVVIGNVGYDVDDAAADVGSGRIDAVSYGRKFIANPDLVHRIKERLPLNSWEPHVGLFYSQEPIRGYLDFPTVAMEVGCQHVTS